MIFFLYPRYFNDSRYRKELRVLLAGIGLRDSRCQVLDAFFRRYFEESGDAKSAVMETLHTTGRAMLVTSCVLSIGFFIFMLATMNNLIHFGFLTGLAIALALFANYFIASALMVIVNRPKKTVHQ